MPTTMTSGGQLGDYPGAPGSHVVAGHGVKGIGLCISLTKSLSTAELDPPIEDLGGWLDRWTVAL